MNRRLRHGSGLVVHQDRVETVEFVSAAGESRDAWRHAYEQSRRRWCRLGFAFSGSDDAALAFLRVFYVDKLLF
jgi:hypothetical protein